MKQILYFTAKWCSNCETMSPVIAQIKKQKRAQVAEVDTDYDVSLVEKYNVRSVPTVVILDNGVEINRHSGALTYEQLNRFI